MDEKQIMETLEAYAAAYCAKDVNAMMRIFDDSDAISVIGTGADELCVGRIEVRDLFLRNFKEATATEFEWGWKDIQLSGNHAIVAITLKIHIDHLSVNLKVPIRWTVVLKKNKNSWVWIHRNASTAASNQDEGQAYPTEN